MIVPDFCSRITGTITSSYVGTVVITYNGTPYTVRVAKVVFENRKTGSGAYLQRQEDTYHLAPSLGWFLRAEWGMLALSNDYTTKFTTVIQRLATGRASQLFRLAEVLPSRICRAVIALTVLS